MAATFGNARNAGYSTPCRRSPRTGVLSSASMSPAPLDTVDLASAGISLAVETIHADPRAG
jgi:hypothetical protein